ncbi:MAG TPA: 16S rRNA (adenine(1518)-N(6)/adenine(1519)-N(6))-dimethyltransferase RsmA [Buchnera sp. (in: enterobacteria)]|nr:16S rRNA (adenine(1518)-N(6)/adenine(1519)-N(6))-dimethyltransferase RsmA [Buchnera sp. (in: enterobacteria)]
MNTQLFYTFHIPQKKFGQHFLINKTVISNIIKLINPKSQDHIIEIGPGRGALTELICKFIKKLNVIEIDRNLVNYLKCCKFGKQLNIFEQDAQLFNFQGFFDNTKKKIRIVGNLPYNISIPLVFYIFKFNSIIHDMHFMFQEEVANRLTAIPGKKNYGRLSIMAQYYCKIIPLLKVSAKFFYPIPKINSMFIKFIPHLKYSYLLDHNVFFLEMITTAAFNQRRKILRHSLSQWFSITDLIQLDIDPKLRAENLSILQYCQLANYLKCILKR